MIPIYAICYSSAPWYDVPGGSCREASIAHFQGWKKSFYRFSTSYPPPDAHAYLLSDTGIIPLRLPQYEGLPSYEQLAQMSGYNYTAFGRLTPHDLPVAVSNNKHGKDKGYSFSHRYLRPYSEERSSTYRWIATAYCSAYATELRKCACPVMGDHIELLYYHKYSCSEDNWKPTVGCDDIPTLITAAWVEDLFPQDGKDVPLIKMFESWKGPKVSTYIIDATLPFVLSYFIFLLCLLRS